MHFHLPLHVSRGRKKLNVYLFEEDWQSAITELDCHPHEAKVWTTRPGFFDGDHESHLLPIHVAASLHAPLDVVRAIVEAYPEGLEKKESSFKRLPIHVACQFAAPVEVIEYMAQEFVAGTLEPDSLGRLPIHYACSNGAPIGVVKALLRANPASMLYEDYNGWLPLHVAVHFGASTEVIEEMIRASPGAVAMKTRKKSTALSLAKKVQTKNREEVIALLTEAEGVQNDVASTPLFVPRQRASKAA